MLLVGRCFYLQIVKHGYYTDVSIKQQKSLNLQRPQRGVILDRFGRVLAASNKVQTIFAEPGVIKNPEEIAAGLAPILGINSSQICKLIRESKNPGFVKLKENADQDECDAVRRFYGIGVQTDWRRYYPTGSLVCHVVGFASRDNKGLDGIELQFDKQLSGSEGQYVFLADSARRPVILKQSSQLSDGVGVILTIDAVIQQFAREELLKQYHEYQAESAIAIVAEPYSGAILAMVSLPDFNPEDVSSSKKDAIRNRAITDQFEPGSLIKPIVVAIAMDDDVITLKDKIFCEYGDYRGKGFGRISEYGNHKYGNLSVRDVLVNSSNIGMAKIGQKVGKDRLYNGMKLFGFGQETGIDLPGEVPGVLWPVEKWTGYSVTRVPFGQEITVTAMQMVRAFCILANGGEAVTPYVVKATVDSEGKIMQMKHPSAPVDFITKPKIARSIVRDALVGVVNEGTGKPAKLEKWQVFGKTGTANIANANSRGYSDTDYVASFLAGAPVENPKIVVLVSIRKPNKRLGKGYTGGMVASPVAGKIIEKTLTYLEQKQ
jgi:cell division protein FtsI/penicillin-binding protein 2